jgi:fibronectin-binding autotransporter adhesin
MKRIVLRKTSNADVADTKTSWLCRRSSSFAIGMALTIVAAGPAVAEPEGGDVVGGRGSITTIGDLTEITQLTDRVSINWDTFNVASGETVRFLQPDSTSVALNTIFDQNASQIFGTIDANGRVLLINPNGMIFGPTAQVNVAGLVASSLSISTADFMAGNYSFEAADGLGGLVLNQGTLQAAPGGFIALLGNAVANEGLIIADAGTIAMGSGNKVALDFDGSGLIYFEVESDVLNSALGVDSAVSNSGSLIADGGQVLLTARAAQDVFTRAINNDGLIQAR